MQNAFKMKAYQRDSLETQLATADPHRIIQLLMAGVIEHCYKAIGAMERKDYEQKAKSITKVSSILTALRSSLDFKQSAELANNLNALYEYMGQRTADASMAMDAEPLKEVAALMSDIKKGWDAIPEDAKQDAYARRADR